MPNLKVVAVRGILPGAASVLDRVSSKAQLTRPCNEKGKKKHTLASGTGDACNFTSLVSSVYHLCSSFVGDRRTQASIGPFYKLLLVRSLRMDRTILTCKEFVRNTAEMGPPFVEPVTDTIEMIFDEMASQATQNRRSNFFRFFLAHFVVAFVPHLTSEPRCPFVFSLLLLRSCLSFIPYIDVE